MGFAGEISLLGDKDILDLLLIIKCLVDVRLGMIIIHRNITVIVAVSTV